MCKYHDIRRMRPEDVNAVMAIWLQGNLQAHPFVAPSYWMDNMQGVREAILVAEVWVCDEGGIIGFIGMVDDYVAGLFVCDTARRQGVGTALLVRAKERHDRLSLHVYRKNTVAVDFYHHASFRTEATGVDGNTGEEEFGMTWRR